MVHVKSLEEFKQLIADQLYTVHENGVIEINQEINKKEDIKKQKELVTND